MGGEPKEVASRLSELESESFQMKLRNYYLEKRLNTTIQEREQSEKHIVKLLERPEGDVVSVASSSAPRKKTSSTPSGSVYSEEEEKVTAPSPEAEALRKLVKSLEKRCEDSAAESERLRGEVARSRASEAEARLESAEMERRLERARLTAEDVVAYEAEQIAALQTQVVALQSDKEKLVSDVSDSARELRATQRLLDESESLARHKASMLAESEAELKRQQDKEKETNDAALKVKEQQVKKKKKKKPQAAEDDDDDDALFDGLAATKEQEDFSLLLLEDGEEDYSDDDESHRSIVSAPAARLRREIDASFAWLHEGPLASSRYHMSKRSNGRRQRSHSSSHTDPMVLRDPDEELLGGGGFDDEEGLLPHAFATKPDDYSFSDPPKPPVASSAQLLARASSNLGDAHLDELNLLDLLANARAAIGSTATRRTKNRGEERVIAEALELGSKLARNQNDAPEPSAELDPRLSECLDLALKLAHAVPPRALGNHLGN